MHAEAVAVLAIPDLVAPPDVALVPRHRGDASLVPVGVPFTPDNLPFMRFALQMLLGDALDEHRDPRGVFFLPATIEPAGAAYEGIIAAVGAAGSWAPWPEEPPEEPPPPRSGQDVDLMAQMAAALGEAAAFDLSIPLEVALVNELAHPHQPSTAPAAEAAIAAAMGAAFAGSLTAALRLRFATELAHGTAPPPIRLE
jgi:hypothetical protein